MRTAFLIEPEDMARLREAVDNLNAEDILRINRAFYAGALRMVLSRAIEIPFPDKPEGGPAQCRTVTKIAVDNSVIQHIDGNPYNNEISNLRRLAFDKGQSAASRVSALQELLARPGDTNDLGVAIKTREERSV